MLGKSEIELQVLLGQYVLAFVFMRLCVEREHFHLVDLAGNRHAAHT